MATAGRYVFSNEQLEQYFDRIALPRSKRISTVSTLSDSEKLAYLKTLIKHQQVRIPFENLTLHYSWHRVIDVSPFHLFRKVTSQRGRGGYCMEVNSLFHTVLLTVGFNCYIAAARVWVAPESRWTGWSHLVNLVSIAGVKYLADVGFGANEPTLPIPLKHGGTVAQIPPAESRLVFEALPQNLSDCKVWIHQSKINAEAEWTPLYCFTEMEVLPTDIDGMNYSPMLGRTSIFTQRVMCVRITTDKEGPEPGLAQEQVIDEGEIDGALIIDHDKFKWRRGGKTVLEWEFQSENERVVALKKYFGIELDVEDRDAILGTISAVPPKQ